MLATAASAQPAPTTQPATQPALPHVHVDRQRNLVDLDAKVVLRQGEWLELLGCSPGTKEHESIVAVQARPSHIHLALLLLGLEPGSPLRWEKIGDQFKIHPPTGPRVAVTLLYDKNYKVPENPDEGAKYLAQTWIRMRELAAAGRLVEVPANEWVIHQETKKTLPDNIWLFTGSELRKIEDQEIYAADLIGTVLSIVNFGDEVLARDTEVTSQDDKAAWNCRTDAIPALGTPVIIRLKPLEKKAAAAKPAATIAPPATTQPAEKR